MTRSTGPGASDDTLTLGSRWTDAARERLRALLDRARARAVDSDAAPVAVFDFDNTCIRHDIGEAFHRYLATEGGYALHGPFQSQLHPLDGRARIEALVARVRNHPDSHSTPRLRRRLRAEIIAAYDRHMEREGKGPTYQWQVQLLAGLEESRVDALARACIEQTLDEPIGCEQLVLRDRVLCLARGVEPYPEMDALFRALEAAGVEIWICSASSHWIVAPFAERFGVPADRVLAARVDVDDDGILTGRSLAPHAYGEGKVALIEAATGRRPILAVGDSLTDLEMLRHSTDEVLVIDRDARKSARGGSTLVDIARREGWIVQPAFHRVAASEPS